MSYKSPNPHQKINTQAIAWALFSQSIWLPVLLTDTQDHIANKNNDYDFSGVAANIPNQSLPPLASLNRRPSTQNTSTLVAQSPKTLENSGVILNASLPKESSILSKLHNTIAPLTSLTSPIAFRPSIRPSILPTTLPTPPSQSESKQDIRTSRLKEIKPLDLLRGLYSRSDLLGGALTLGNLNEPLMPPIARAEQAQSVRSGDPLSTIPKMWREPMRQALKNLSETLNPPTTLLHGKSTAIAVEQARVIHVPSSRVKRVSEVPLALQSDGTVDILNSPDDPEVVEEIKTWSSKQKLPDRGRMAPAVVHLHPIPEQDKPPISEKVTHVTPQPAAQQTMPQIQSAAADPAPAPPAPVPVPVVHQEASVPDVLPPSHPSPTPPPPVETQTSSLPPLEAEATIAEVPADVSAPISNGVVQ
jgi:hypothetical protein